jgi:hypothetical protein
MTMAYKKRVTTELTGKWFGELQVIGRAVNEKSEGLINAWNCLCGCGKAIRLPETLLHRGRISCGCLGGRLGLAPYSLILKKPKPKHVPTFPNYDGQTFSHFKVLSRVEGLSWLICECVCGNITKERERSVIKGVRKSCGCRKGEQMKLAHKAKRIAKGLNPDYTTKELEKNERKLFNRVTRLEAFHRDNFTCLLCGDTKARLNAHHIKKWSKFPALRFTLSNIATLCEDCHEVKVHKLRPNDPPCEQLTDKLDQIAFWKTIKPKN